jgi:hypothetical protein
MFSMALASSGGACCAALQRFDGAAWYCIRASISGTYLDLPDASTRATRRIAFRNTRMRNNCSPWQIVVRLVRSRDVAQWPPCLPGKVIGSG